VIEARFAEHHRIFVGAEALEAMLEEIVRVREGVGARDRDIELGDPSGMAREPILHHRDDLGML